jgi:hypothetical protein
MWLSVIVNQVMKTLKLILFVVLQFFFLKGIFSEYEIILEKFETLLGDDDQILEFLSLRLRKFNKSSWVFCHLKLLKIIKFINNSIIKLNNFNS